MFVVLTDTVDLLEAVGINQLPLGVVNTTGICDRRADEDIPDLAYRLTQRAVLTVSTAEVFQGKKKLKKKKKEIQKQRPQQLLFLFFLFYVTALSVNNLLCLQFQLIRTIGPSNAQLFIDNLHFATMKFN